MKTEGCEESARFGHCSCDVVKAVRARKLSCSPTALWALYFQLSTIVLVVVLSTSSGVQGQQTSDRFEAAVKAAAFAASPTEDPTSDQFTDAPADNTENSTQPTPVETNEEDNLVSSEAEPPKGGKRHESEVRPFYGEAYKSGAEEPPIYYTKDYLASQVEDVADSHAKNQHDQYLGDTVKSETTGLGYGQKLHDDSEESATVAGLRNSKEVSSSSSLSAPIPSSDDYYFPMRRKPGFLVSKYFNEGHNSENSDHNSGYQYSGTDVQPAEPHEQVPAHEDEGHLHDVRYIFKYATLTVPVYAHPKHAHALRIGQPQLYFGPPRATPAPQYTAPAVTVSPSATLGPILADIYPNFHKRQRNGHDYSSKAKTLSQRKFPSIQIRSKGSDHFQGSTISFTTLAPPVFRPSKSAKHVPFTLNDAVVFDKKLKSHHWKSFGPSVRYRSKRPSYENYKVVAESSEAFSYDHNFLNDRFFKKYFKRQAKTANAAKKKQNRKQKKSRA